MNFEFIAEGKLVIMKLLGSLAIVGIVATATIFALTTY
jgi:hypothetical protein